MRRQQLVGPGAEAGHGDGGELVRVDVAGCGGGGDTVDIEHIGGAFFTEEGHDSAEVTEIGAGHADVDGVVTIACIDQDSGSRSGAGDQQFVVLV